MAMSPGKRRAKYGSAVGGPDINKDLGGRDKKEDTAEMIDNILGPSPNLAKAEEVQEERFDPQRGKDKGIFGIDIGGGFNKFYDDLTLDNAYGFLGNLAGSFLGPTTQGPIALANISNFNPRKDPETGEITVALTDRLGLTEPGTTGLFNQLDLRNYEGAEDVDRNKFLDAAFDFDKEGKFIGRNLERFEQFVEDEGLSLTQDYLDRQRILEEVKEEAKKNTRGRDRVPVFDNVEAVFADDEQKALMYQKYLRDGYPPDLAEYLVNELGVFGV